MDGRSGVESATNRSFAPAIGIPGDYNVVRLRFALLDPRHKDGADAH